MDWVKESKRIFQVEKPEHFTNYMHCEECAEHDETLKNSDVDSIGMEQLGKLGWDPMCFCSVVGKIYYMPALIKLCAGTLNDDEPYLMQFLFHLEGDGENNNLVLGCTPKQRQFVFSFLEHIVEEYAKEIERLGCTDDALRVHEIWKQA